MRILVVTTWFPTPGRPEVGVFVARDVAALAERHEVRVLHLVAPHLAPPRSAEDDGALQTQVLDFPGMAPVTVRVRRLVTDLRRPDHLARAGRAVLAAARNADVVHTAAFSTLLPLLGRRPPAPWVHTEHWHGVATTDGDRLPVRLVTPLLRRLLRRPDVVTAVSSCALGPVRRLRGERPSLVVPCVVAPPGRVPERPERNGRPLRLVAVGGLVEGKRPRLAVEVLAALRELGQEAELTWVGTGPLRRELATLAGERGVVVRVTGSLPPSGVCAELAHADAFLLPTRRETFGVAVAEAAAHGRPVVTGAEVGVREWLDGPGVAYVEGEDPRTWARALLELLDRTSGTPAAELAAALGDAVCPAQVRRAFEHAYAMAAVGTEPTAGSTCPEPQVDVVVAVHTTERPVDRAVRSVLATRAPVRVTVVCHGVPAEKIADRLGSLPELARSRGHEVRLVEHEDGVRSPAGPFNKGLDLAEAEFVALLGSDDRLERGALDSWLALAQDADVVVPRLAYARPDGSVREVVPTPPARPGRRRRLDPVRDRLAYRSAPLGLVRRQVLERLGLRHVEGVPVGEDLELSTRLWFEGGRVAFDRRGPAYLVGEDAGDRVTFAGRPVAEDLAWLPPFLSAGWFGALPLEARRAIAVKVLRIHVFGAVHYRPGAWRHGERADLERLTRLVLEAAPGCERVLSRAERDLLDAVLDPSVPVDRLAALSARRRRHGAPATLLTRDLRQMLAREAPLRLMTASVLARY